MFKLKVSSTLRALAAGHGVTIPAQTKVNSASSLSSLSSKLKKAPAVNAFAIPPIGVSADTAIKAAGQVLKHGSSSGVLVNTQALAALGDTDAQRGLQALMTARAIQAKGKALPAPPKHIKASQFNKQYPKSEVFRLAQIKTSMRVNLWTRVKSWFQKLGR